MDFKFYYEQQKRLQELFKAKYPGAEALHTGNTVLDETKFKEHVLLMIKEIVEILDEINYKPHRHQHVHNKKPLNKERITEEIVDAFKYLMNLMLIFGIEADEFEKKYIEKHQIVKQRIYNNL